MEVLALLYGNASDYYKMKKVKSPTEEQELFLGKAYLTLQQFSINIVNEIQQFSYPSQCMTLQEAYNDEYDSVFSSHL